MRLRENFLINLIEKYLIGLLTIYVVGWILFALCFFILYFLSFAYNTIDFIVYHTTGARFLRPKLQSRRIKIHDYDVVIMSLVIIMGLWYFKIEKPQDDENRARELANHRRIDSMENIDNSTGPYTTVVVSDNDTVTKPANAIDTAKIVQVKVDTITKKRDTTQLISFTPTGENSGYKVSDKLPLTYSRGLQKWVFRKQDTVLLIDSYYNGGKCATYIGRQQDNIIAITQYQFFTCNKGIVRFNSSLDNSSFQLYESSN